MKKLVSIIIPVHNSSKYLKRCIESVVNQTYKNIEIIAVENGSTDNSLDILETYNKSINVQVIDEASISSARNKGLELARGDYISFVDSDDEIELTMIEKLVNSIDDEKSDMSVCNINEIYEETGKVVKREVYPYELVRKSTIEENLIEFNYAIWNKLYKREIIEKNKIRFPENVKYEDIPFMLHYLINCNNVSKVSDYLYNYKIHSNSEQTTVNKRVYDIFKILDIASEYITYELLEDLYVRELLTYSLKMRYVEDKHFKDSFIDEVYKKLESKYSNWRKSKYVKSLSLMKRTIVKSPFLVKLYTHIYYDIMKK